GRMPIAQRSGERFDRCGPMVVVKDAGERRQKNALAVGAGAVEEEKRMLPCVPGQQVTGNPLQIRLKFGVLVRDLLEELQPTPTRATRRDGRHLGDVVGRPVRSLFSRAQINGAGWGVEQPCVAVPLLHSCGYAPVLSSEIDDGAPLLVAGRILLLAGF